jgi:hypothetical protein
MGRIRASIEIVKASWAVLAHDRELLWLPVLSFLATAVTVALFAGGFLAVGGTDVVDGGRVQPTIGSYVLLFVMYLVLAIITVFFNAALVSAAHERLRGGDPSVESALAGATSRFGLLLPWALVSATVSTILKSLQERAGLLGRIVIGVVGIAWALVTFLVLPVIVVEGLSVGAAIKRSKDLFTRTWGEQVVGNAAIGLVSFLAILGFGLVAVPLMFTGVTAVLIAAIVAWVVWAAIVSAVGAAMSGIFQTALYLYASTGEVPSGFSPVAIEAAFRPKRTGARGAFLGR